MKYRAMVLTPTLVGDGNRLAPIDYMVWRDQVNVLDQTRIFKLLSRGPRLEGYLQQLSKATRLDFASWGGFAQNYADRHIPFEDPSCTPNWNAAATESLFIPTFAAAAAGPYLPGAAIKGALRTAYVFSRIKPSAIKEMAEKMASDKPPRRIAEQLEQQASGQGGSDRMRAVSVSDSGATKRDQYKVYMCRTSSLVPKGPTQFSLGWKQTEFAEMAAPGTLFEGTWKESDFLNGRPGRHREGSPGSSRSCTECRFLPAGRRLGCRFPQQVCRHRGRRSRSPQTARSAPHVLPCHQIGPPVPQDEVRGLHGQPPGRPAWLAGTARRLTPRHETHCG